MAIKSKNSTHTHANLDELNSITQDKIREWDNKEDKEHIHDEYLKELPYHTHNKDEIEGFENIEVDLSNYATINYVDSEIAKIELKEGPQDTKEDPGTIDITTQFSDLLTIDKTIIGAINENTDKINILSDNIENTNSQLLIDTVNEVDNLNIKTNYITPEMFGATGDGISDDTEAFQKCIDYCTSSKGSIKIQLLPKTYVIGTINLKRYTYIQGYGWKSTFLKVKNGLDTSLLSITESNANLITLKDFCILGDNENNTCPSALVINKVTQVGEEDENWRASDSWTVVENIRIVSMYGNGIETINGARECRFTNLNISNCLGWGMDLRCCDNNYQFITCWCNIGGGIKINGSAERLVSCKCFANGSRESITNGFYIGDTIGVTMISCEAQENFGHGFYLKKTKNSSFIGIRADCNGLVDKGQEELNYSGIYLEGDVQNIILTGVCDDFRRVNNSGASQKTGITLGSLMYSSVHLIVKNNLNTYEAPKSFVLTRYGKNNLIINGETIAANQSIFTEIKEFDGMATLSLGMVTDPMSYQFVKKSSGDFQIDTYVNGQWKRAPFAITSGNSVKLGSNDSLIGFFGSYGTVKQTSSDNATDLESAIYLVNNLKSILKGYGLIY